MMDEEEEDKELLKIRIETLKTMIGKLKKNSADQSSKISKQQAGPSSAIPIQPKITIQNIPKVPETWSKLVSQRKLNNKYKFTKTAEKSHSDSELVLNIKNVPNNIVKRLDSVQQTGSRFKWDKYSLPQTAVENVIVPKMHVQQASGSSRTFESKFKLVKCDKHKFDNRKVPTTTTMISDFTSKTNNHSFQPLRKLVSESTKICSSPSNSKYKFVKGNTQLIEKYHRKQPSANSFTWRKDETFATPYSGTLKQFLHNPHYSFIQRRYNFIKKKTPVQMKYRQLAYILLQYKLLKKRRLKESFASRRLRFVKSRSIEVQRVSHQKFKKSTTSSLHSPNKDLILSRHGTNYKVAGNLKSLRRISADGGRKKIITIPENPEIASSKYKFYKASLSTSVNRKIASRVLKRSLTLAQRKKVNKTKFCLFFNRFGKCNRGDKCKYIHDPEKVAVCTRFLRGTCKDDNCLFSHKIDPKKMPVCSYFLLGKCTNDKCPYRHVNVSHDADVCQDFLKGYCPREDKCTRKHILDCVEFTTKGTCSLGKKCPMVHRIKHVKKRRRTSSISGIRKPKRFQEKQPKADLSLISPRKLEVEIQTCVTGETIKPGSSTNLDSPLRNKGKLHLLPKFISEKISQGDDNPTSFSAVRNLFNFEKNDITAPETTSRTKRFDDSSIQSDSSSENDSTVEEDEREKGARAPRRFSFKEEQDFISLE